MKQLVIGFVSMFMFVICLSAQLPFGQPQFCDGEQIQSMVLHGPRGTRTIEKKRFAGHCRWGITVTPARELAFAFLLTLPVSFDSLPPIYDIVTISDDGVTMIFESPLVGTIRVTNPQWTSTQALVINLKRFKIERDASVIWFVFQDEDADWADNYIRSLKEFAN